MMRTAFLLMLFALTSAGEIAAQVSGGSYRADRLNLAPSDPGIPVSSRFVDPFMSTRQADQIYEYLQRPYKFKWDGSTTIQDIHDDLSQHLSVVVDVAALEEIGLSIDTVIHRELVDRKPGKPKGFPDPFAGNDPPKKQLHLAGQVPWAGSTEQFEENKWWVSRNARSDDETTICNGARLFHFLDRIDLTLNVQNGQLKITTFEASEQSCCVRIFDVTSLVDLSGRVEMGNHPIGADCGSFCDGQSLIDLLQTTVVPDSWEALGGPSTMTVYSTPTRCWLAVSSPLAIHWKIQALLNQLNQ